MTSQHLSNSCHEWSIMTMTLHSLMRSSTAPTMTGHIHFALQTKPVSVRTTRWQNRAEIGFTLCDGMNIQASERAWAMGAVLTAEQEEGGNVAPRCDGMSERKTTTPDIMDRSPWRLKNVNVQCQRPVLPLCSHGAPSYIGSQFGRVPAPDAKDLEGLQKKWNFDFVVQKV